MKSPPELWAECSNATSLARHLDRFGEIRITRLDPETAVAWEGERARGTVRIEPAGWGTKVILTAVAEGEEPVAGEEEPVAEGEEAVARARPPAAPEALAVSDEPAAVSDEPAAVSDEPAARAGDAPVLADEAPPPDDARPPQDVPGSELSDTSLEAPSPAPRKRRFARLRAFWRGERFVAPAPAAEDPPVEEPRVAELSEQPPEPGVPASAAPHSEVEVRPGTRDTEPDAAPAARDREGDVAPGVPEVEPELVPDVPEIEANVATAAPEAPPPDPSQTEAALFAALDSLGQAHHRPFSRA